MARLSDCDVREHVRAVFVPIIRKKTVRQQVRAIDAPPVPVSSWRPFQVTVSERRPVLKADRTVFNLVPCNRSLEQALVEFLGKASDITAFAKNAGPQALHIDYLADGQRLAFYTPDFLVRTDTGYYVAETKGQVDRDVPAKARAAAAWCKSASGKAAKWEYVFISEEVFQRFQGTTFSELIRMCSPSLNDLLKKEVPREELPLFAGVGIFDTVMEQTKAAEVVAPDQVLKLPERFRKAVDEAVSLYLFFERKQGVNYAPVFSALLGVMDEVAKGLVIQKLSPYLPQAAPEQREWFAPYLAKVDHRMQRHYQELGRNLQKTLVYKTGVSPLGLLRNCLDYALNDQTPLTGVFTAVREEFQVPGARTLLSEVQSANDFRNTSVAHQEMPLNEALAAKKALKEWVSTLVDLWNEQVDSAYALLTAAEVVRFRDKDDQTSDFIAEIKVILPQISLPRSSATNYDLNENLRKTIEMHLQPLADHRFGSNNVRVQCSEIRAGSIDLSIVISTIQPYAVAVAIYKFVKDYDKLRTNSILLTGDIKRNSGKLKKVLNAILINNKNTLI